MAGGEGGERKVRCRKRKEEGKTRENNCQRRRDEGRAPGERRKEGRKEGKHQEGGTKGRRLKEEGRKDGPSEPRRKHGQLGPRAPPSRQCAGSRAPRKLLSTASASQRQASRQMATTYPTALL
ncbi:hypothetical protein E2C01_081199 [Portunus trituberculatus]|uniref:Uncharacterized protein n=1 Tax=Portunus trituberculatus TaxID=210409 RepID=A0A5B7J1L9_PORTR|nr:hypothetical protein [Portunus trituberculatus]